jgi:hypothetical protein
LRQIPGFKNYSITSSGQIYSHLFKRYLNLGTCNAGYKRICLVEGGKKKNFLVHRLVLLAYVGPSDMVCNHKDADKFNNRLENLEYVSQKENITHSVRLGLRKNMRSEVLNLLSNGFSFHEVKKELNISYSYVSKIKRKYGN